MQVLASYVISNIYRAEVFIFNFCMQVQLTITLLRRLMVKRNWIKDFLALETAGGLLLIASAFFWFTHRLVYTMRRCSTYLR